MWENDLKAPRFRMDQGRVQLNTLAMAKDFLRQNPHSNFKTPQQVLDALKDVHMTIRDIAQNERDGFEIPYFGVLIHRAVGAPKSKRVTPLGKEMENYIDYKTSLLVKKLVKFTNFDTDGKVLKIRLDYGLIKYRITNLECWVFRPCRDYKRAASKVFKTNYTKLTQV